MELDQLTIDLNSKKKKIMELKLKEEKKELLYKEELEYLESAERIISRVENGEIILSPEQVEGLKSNLFKINGTLKNL